MGRLWHSTLGENCAFAANQSNRGFNWPVFGVRMHKKSPNATEIMEKHVRYLMNELLKDT